MFAKQVLNGALILLSSSSLKGVQSYSSISQKEGKRDPGQDQGIHSELYLSNCIKNYKLSSFQQLPYLMCHAMLF